METPSTIDPFKPPTVTLTGKELDEIEQRIADGELPQDYFQRYYAALDANVFGADHKRDANGRPLEQGLGSENNMTRQSVEAYRRFGVTEPNYERHLARMEKQLAECEKRRAAEAAKRPPHRFGRR